MTDDVLALRHSPLGPLADELAAYGGLDTVAFAERPFRVQVELRTERSGVPDDPLGMALPPRVGAVASVADRHALCLGPGWWLVTDKPADEPLLECALAVQLRSVGGDAVSAVDVSAQRTTIDVSGPYARAVLAHGCSLDLHPREFGPGRCAQSQLAKAQIVLHQLDDRPTFRILVRASFAGYLGHWLLDAATEYVS